MRALRGANLNALAPAMRAWLAAPDVALLDVQVDPQEEAATPDKLAIRLVMA